MVRLDRWSQIARLTRMATRRRQLEVNRWGSHGSLPFDIAGLPDKCVLKSSQLHICIGLNGLKISSEMIDQLPSSFEQIKCQCIGMITINKAFGFLLLIALLFLQLKYNLIIVARDRVERQFQWTTELKTASNSLIWSTKHW
jgi:hypothetical protein